jgi:hypothetical protein
MLCVLIAAIGIGTIVSTVWLVIRSYSPALFWDQWMILDPLIKTHDHPGLTELWAQHNEHRIVIQRLLAFADLRWFHSRNITLLAETMLTQGLHLALLVWACRRFGKLARLDLLSVSGFLAYALFSPLQAENFTWAFQVAFVLVGLCASASVVSLVEFKRQLTNGHSGNLAFAACIAAACLAELSNANGVLVWPLLSLAGFVLYLPRRRQLALALTGASAIALYLIGYHSPGNHSDPIKTIRQPGKLLKFVETCFGFSFDPTLPNVSHWPVIFESLTVIAILVFAALTWSVFRKKGRASLLVAFAALNGCFYIASVIVIALGRLKFGYGQATASRYQSFALVFWACIAIAGYALLENGSLRLKTTVQVVLLVLLLSSVSRFQGIWKAAIDRQHGLNQAWEAFERGDYDNPATFFILPPSGETPKYARYLVTHGLIPPPIVKPPWDMDVYACKGWIDYAKPIEPNEFSSFGWAYAFAKSGARLKIFLGSA